MIRLRTLLTEAVTINGVTLRATNTQSGGPIEASWDGNAVKYSVAMDSIVYSGAIGVTAIYKEDGEYRVLTNRKQREELKLDQLNKLVDAIKSGDAEIEIAGRLGSTITFRKKS
jgi:hypothetical protein